MIRYYLLATTLLMVPSFAAAEDTEMCRPGLICATNPVAVADAMRKAGYQAKLGADDGGDPMISSAASGYNYDLFFYGCKEHKNCDSLQFRITFTAEKINTPELANKWNSDKRFGQAAIDSKGRFIVSFDLATIGGLNERNFEDVLEWWGSTLGSLSKFWKENPVK